MIEKLKQTKFYEWVCRHKKLLIIAMGSCVTALIVLIISSYIYVGTFSRYVITPSDLDRGGLLLKKDINSDQYPIYAGIVFGAGISSDNKPYKELQARLDVAADAIVAGKLRVLLLSGDNRFPNYNEPEVMKTYLVEQRHISADVLQLDYAGRSTYETCERAKKIFSIDRAVLFSAESHLPRAVFLCRHFGVESYGIASGIEANNATRREFIARSKATFNAFIFGEKTILGEKIPIVELTNR